MKTATDLREIKKLARMDCIRLINYLERKEKPCKESKR